MTKTAGKFSLRRVARETTEYLGPIAGTDRNHNLPVEFDLSGSGSVGITQYEGPDSRVVADRVLLSRDQVEALLEFIVR